jgi:hypothetical protein
MGTRATIEGLTNIQYVSSPTRVQAQWRIAGRAILRLKLLDIFVEAGFVGDMATGELQDALSTEGMF